MKLNSNHVNPSTSSGSSPGVTFALAPRLPRIPAAESLGTSPSFVSSKSLVVNKRELPAVLRNDVPPLHIAGTAAESLIVTPNRLPGVLHLDVGKQIQHRGQTVRILNVHENIRLVVPLGEEEHRAFWIPRRAVNRGDSKEERIKRHYVVGINKAFVAPHWTGEPRPRAEAVTLPPWENLISEDLYTLTKSLGKYENRLIPESSYWDMLSISPPTRHQRRLLEQKTREKYAALREKLRERLLRQILEESRLPEEKQLAVYDVLGLGQLIEQAAAARRVPPVSLENTVRRITTNVNQAYQAALQQYADNAIPL
jgi:hypothetical protein